MSALILDQYGKPFAPPPKEMPNIGRIQAQFRAELAKIKASYDAAATTSNNENHWANADYLDPHTANNHGVRRVLRARSRYELIENNPYLKGCILTLANDFVGGGPKLQITDKRLSNKARKAIEDKFNEWICATGFYNKLWRMRMAKLVDGETFAITYTTKKHRLEYRDMPVRLNFYIAEADRITSPIQGVPDVTSPYVEVDGMRWDRYENPLSYHMLDTYPGHYLFMPATVGGKWIDADQVIHWFRQDRGWLRGIPELTPSLQLCALLRRYTLAVVRSAEYAACFSALLESELPPGVQHPNTANGTQTDIFESFPVEHGMFTVLPWGYKMSQLKATQPMAVFDEFVDVLLREIVRPIHMPFNLAAGTSKDANMSSALLDIHVYKGGQAYERKRADEVILDHVFVLWYQEASRIWGYLPREARIYQGYPSRMYRWDKIGLDHTDPQKVAEALKIAHDKGFITDRDVQEIEYNRSEEEWQESMKEQVAFRESIDNLGMVDAMQPPPPEPAGASGGKSKSKSSSKKTTSKKSSK